MHWSGGAHPDNMARNMCHSGYVTYAANGGDPLSGGPLETLFVQGEVFPMWNANIIEKKSKATSDMLRDFYCPVCPTAVLRLGVDPLAKCVVCTWTSKKVDGLHSVSDLMARDVEPWPKVVKKLNEAVGRWKRRVEAKQSDELKYAGEQRKRNNGKDLWYDDEVGRDSGSDEAMRGLIKPWYRNVEDKCDIDERDSIQADTILIAPNVYRNFEIPPKRRLPQNVVQIAAPAGNRIVHDAVLERPKKSDNAAKLLPRVTSVVVDRECGKHTPDNNLAQLWLEIANDTKSAVEVTIANHSKQKILPNSKQIVELKASGRYVRHGEIRRSEFVVPLLFLVNVVGIEEELSYYVFVWHYRDILTPEVAWSMKTGSKTTTIN